MDCDFSSIRQDDIGLTQSGLARKLGCSRSKIQRVEKGIGFYTPMELIKFSQLAGKSVEELFGVGPVKPSEKTATIPDLQLPKWFKDYQRLTKVKQKLIEETIEPLIKWLKK